MYLRYLACLVPALIGSGITVGAMNLFEYVTVRQKIDESDKATVIRERRLRNDAIQQYPSARGAFTYVLDKLTTPGRSIALREWLP